MKIPGTLSIELTATCDEPTLCNLAHHSYFNLDDGGSGDILDHRLMLAAAAYLPVDDELIPTGVVQPVDGTAFDFRLARPIRMESEGEQLALRPQFLPRRGARSAAGRRPGRRAPSSGVEMEVWTTEPGLQFYAGAQGRARPCRASAAAATRPMPASASSRRSGRIRPTGRISRRPCCGRARSTGR